MGKKNKAERMAKLKESAARIQSKSIKELKQEADKVEAAPEQATAKAEEVQEAPEQAANSEPAKEASAPAPVPASPEVKVPKKPVIALHKSEIASPVKTVWAIAEAMRKADPNARRKDIVAACISAGIADHTAKTQFQLWFTASKAKPTETTKAPEQATA